MPIKQQVRLGVLLIATRKYKQFVKPLAEQLEKFITVPFEIVLFTDQHYYLDTKVTVNNYIIPEYKFPEATLYRYKIFGKQSNVLQERFTHLLYSDVDMGIEKQVGEEFIVDGLVAVRHPGTYATDRWGSPNNPKESTSWFPEEKRKHYYCGGVQGGATKHYLDACKILSENIAEDEKNKVMSEWHDETHWNKYVNYERPELVTELSPSYCMPEQKKHRSDWGLNEFEPIIIALDKNHKDIRS